MVGPVLSSACQGMTSIAARDLPTRTRMSSSCEGLLAALKDCLLHSDCVLKQGYLPSQCLREHADELPEECRSLRKATFECKRGMVCLLPHFLTVYIVTESVCCSWICGSGSGATTLACRQPLWSQRKPFQSDCQPSCRRLTVITHANRQCRPCLVHDQSRH